MMDTSKVCRLCAKSKTECVDIFNEESCELQISNKINKYLMISVSIILNKFLVQTEHMMVHGHVWDLDQVHPQDVLPTVVCRQCSERLLEISKFCEETLQAQEILQQLCQATTSSPTLSRERTKDALNLTCCTSKNDSESQITASNSVGSKASKKSTQLSVGGASKSHKAQTVLASLSTWLCTNCEAVLHSSYELQMHHQVTHQQAVRFQCMQCTKVFLVYSKFSRHVRQHWNEGRFRCDICGRGFSSKQALQNHKALHVEVTEDFVCEICGRSFQTAVSLGRHKGTHQRNVSRGLSCPHCCKSVTSYASLRYHLRVHSAEKNFTCEVCGVSFRTKQTLGRHAMSHSGDRPHVCNACPKAFKTAYQLRVHQDTHTGRKAHQCEVCGRCFRQRSTLASHSLVHTGAKPYACEFCGQHFRFRGVHMIHRRLHTGERPYTCTKCGSAFNNFSNYSKHKKQRHPSPQHPTQSELQTTCLEQPSLLPTSSASCVDMPSTLFSIWERQHSEEPHVFASSISVSNPMPPENGP